MKKKGRKNNQKRQEGLFRHQVMTGVGIVICIILLPVLMLNITLIIKSYVNTDEVPSVGGYLPMIVLTDSMYPGIQSGDLIICHTLEPEDVQVGDVISFFDPAGNGSAVVTHRVVELTSEDGGLAYRTKGDANNVEDAVLVPAENLVGIYRTRLAGVGNIAMFMQTTAGLVICVVCPLILLIAYDILRRRKYEREKQKDTEALLAELEELKQQRERRLSEKETALKDQGAGKKRTPQRRRSTGVEEDAPQRRRRAGAGEEDAPRRRRQTGAGEEDTPRRRRSTRAGEEEERARQGRRQAGEEDAPRRRRQTGAGEEAQRRRRQTGAGEEEEHVRRRRRQTGAGEEEEHVRQRRRQTGAGEEDTPRRRRRTGDGYLPQERQNSGQDNRPEI